MSQLLTQIKADLLQARKERNQAKAGCLSTLVGECMTKEKTADKDKPFTDEDVKGVIKKTVKNLNACLSAPISLEAAEGFKTELGWLEGYLPKTMSADELQTAMEAIMVGMDNPSVGPVMGALKKQYAGLYDGALAKQIFDRLNK